MRLVRIGKRDLKAVGERVHLIAVIAEKIILAHLFLETFKSLFLADKAHFRDITHIFDLRLQ